jgi:2-C-methyl-D-erythritol 4-phosphate cytidylyltransferase/2-C-methyl-D-erythritol 2,4-cyclodiphosphate synthase
LALGDIGEHFPDTDPAWKGAASSQFVEHAVGLIKQHQCRIINVDCTLVLESPKILPFKQAMRENIARLCGLPLERVAVKATTSERMGYVGRKEGVHAFVACEVQPE